MAAILNAGLTDIRDALASKASHVGVSEDTTAFNASQTALNPSGADSLVKAASSANVDFKTTDITVTITGASEFTGNDIRTVGLCSGGSVNDVMSRSVRAGPIHVQAGDVFTIGVRVVAEDNSP